MNYTIDATNRKLGRVASEAAKLLLGKGEPTFEYYKKEKFGVEVINVSKLDVDEKKLLEKTYLKYSGYPGGLKSKTMAQVIGKKGYSEVLKLAVKGMLPSNKHKSHLMKRLKVVE